MNTCNLTDKHCVPCEGGIPPLQELEISELKKEINENWQVIDNTKLRREFIFTNFVETMKFVNQVADLSESEGHHPDMQVSYSKLVVELWTHAVNGLTESDFILAAKIDKL